MRLIADTNILIRVIVGDDLAQAEIAQSALLKADLIAVPLPVLCELCWVLKRSYGAERAEIADAVRKLVASTNVITDNTAVEAGLAILEAGGDFADGVIAHQGRTLGGDTFLTFDSKAARLLADAGQPVRLLP